MSNKDLRAPRLALLKKLLQNQADLNYNSYGTDWFEKGRRREWSYPTAIADELQEYARSIWTPWWSKENKFDITNAQIELVDVLHFLLSELLITYSGDEVDVDATAEQVVDIIEDVWDILNDWGVFKTVSTYQFFGERIQHTIEGISTLQWHAYRFDATDPEAVGTFLTIFITLVAFTFDKDLTFRTFTNLYFAKSVLNKFRQDNGYREKKYKKIWDDEGHEDNYYLTQYVNAASAVGEIPERQIYDYLTNKYKEVV